MAEISVIVPVYKVEPYLCRCVNSLICQSFHNFDLILVDDGSPDRCGEICDEFALKDDRIHVIHQKNRGLSAARNAGIIWSLKNSNSQWISFVDSDDWVHPLYLELLLKAVTDTGYDVAIGGYFRTYGDTFPDFDEAKKNAIPRRVDDYYIKSMVNATVSWGKLCRKEYYESIRFPVGKIHEDEHTTYRILFQQEYVAVVDLPLYAYYQNTKGIMMQAWSPKRLDALQAFEEQVAFFISINRMDIAKIVFKRLIDNILFNQQQLEETFSLTMSAKKKYKVYLNKQLRRELIKQRSYKLFPFKESEDNKQVYVIAFPAIGVMRKQWQVVKPILKSVPPVYILGKAVKYSQKKVPEIQKEFHYIRRVFLKKALLLQSPLYANLGDQAIAIAELQVLRKLKISCLDYPWKEDVERICARFTPEKCLILQQGGGNLGQLWMREENRFRATLSLFRNHNIIVFPQTIYFDMETEEGRACFEKSREIYESHQNMTMFVREQFSYDFMREYMPKVNVQLVPDMAMLLCPPKERKNQGRQGILLCLRNDKERTITAEMRERLNKVLNASGEKITITDTAFAGDVDICQREQLLNDKLSEFLTSSLVITDRLHGMIFSAITETPCIVFSSLSPKIRGCYEWIKDLDYIRLVDNIEEVAETIEELKEVTPMYNREEIEKAMTPLYEALLKATK